MSLEPNKEIARQFFGFFNQGNQDGVMSLVASDVIIHDPFQGVMHDAGLIRQIQGE